MYAIYLRIGNMSIFQVSTDSKVEIEEALKLLRRQFPASDFYVL